MFNNFSLQDQNSFWKSLLFISAIFVSNNIKWGSDLFFYNLRNNEYTNNKLFILKPDLGHQ